MVRFDTRMSFKQSIYQVYHGFQNNPGLILLAVCGVAAVLFISLIFSRAFFVG
jgi:hypothetical protein